MHIQSDSLINSQVSSKFTTMLSLMKPKLQEDTILLIPNAKDSPWLLSTTSIKNPMRLSKPMGKLIIWISNGCKDPSSFISDLGTDEDSVLNALSALKKSNIIYFESESHTQQTKPKLLSLLNFKNRHTSATHTDAKLLHKLTICNSLEERMLIEDNAPSDPSFVFRSLFDIEWRVFSHPRQFRWLQKITTSATVYTFSCLFILFGVTGVIPIILQWNLFYAAGTSSLSVQDMIYFFALLFLAIIIHELCHGSLLAYYGGRIRSFGVMLLYLSPACFCDITNSWYLPYKKQRFFIAIAGVISTFGIAGLCAWVFYAVRTIDTSWLGILSIYLYVIGIINLIPFVHFDGYIATMSLIDEPHLREHTMQEWKTFVFNLFTTQPLMLNITSFLRILFGMCCSLTPLILLGIPVLMQPAPVTWIGWIMSFVASFFLWIICILVIRGIYLIATTSSTHKKINWLYRTMIAILCSALLIPIFFIPIQSFTLGTFKKVDNALEIHIDYPIRNQKLYLYSEGLIGKREVGTLNITGDYSKYDETIPISRLSSSGNYFPEEGTVQVNASSVPLWNIFANYISFHISQLRST